MQAYPQVHLTSVQQVGTGDMVMHAKCHRLFDIQYMYWTRPQAPRYLISPAFQCLFCAYY
jgi:hypothetical protein